MEIQQLKALISCECGNRVCDCGYILTGASLGDNIFSGVETESTDERIRHLRYSYLANTKYMLNRVLKYSSALVSM